MADNNNPIKYSDLVQPDTSITDLIEQLKALGQQYEETLSTLRKEAKAASESIEKVSGATEKGRQTIDKAAKEAERLAAAERKVQQAQSANAKEIERLNRVAKEQNQINRLMVQLNNSAEGSYNRLSAQYALNKIKLNQMSAAERSAVGAGSDLEKETRKIYEEMKRLQEATGKFQLNVGNYPKAMGGFLGTFVGGSGGSLISGLGAATTGIGALAVGTMAFAGAAKEGVATAREFEAAQSTLSAISQSTVEQLAKLREQARELGSTTRYTATEVTQLQTELAKLGYTTDEILNMTEGILRFAQATGAGLAESSSLVGATLRIFEKDTTHTMEFVDKMAVSTTKSALSFEYLSTAMSTIGPVANAFGFNVEDVLALLGELANKGFDASSAATATRNILLNLADANGALAKALGKPVTNLDELVDGMIMLNNANIDLATALELTDKRSVAAFNSFISGADNVRNLRDALNSADGAAKQMASTMADNLEGDVASLGSAWDDLWIEINNGQGILRTIVQALTSFVGKCKEVYKDIKGYFTDLYNESEGWRWIVESIGYTFSATFSFIGSILHGFWRELEATGKMLKGVFTLDWDLFYEGAKDALRNIKKEADDYLLEQEKRNKETTDRIAGHEGKPAHQVGERKKIGTWICEWDGNKWVGVEKAEKKKTPTPTPTIKPVLPTGDDKKGKTKKEKEVDPEKEAEKQRKAQYKLEIDLLRSEEKAVQLKLDVVEKGSVEELRLRAELYEKRRAIELRENAELAKELQQDEAAINAKYDNLIQQELRKSAISREQTEIDQAMALRKSEIDIMKGTEEEKTRERLKAEKDRYLKILALNEKFGNILTATEVETMRNAIEKIDQEITASKKSEKVKDIYSVFGLSLDDKKKDAINTSIGFAMEQVNAYADALVAAADKAVEASNREIDAAQNKLNAELQARASGYASNVAMAQKELDNAKKNQEKALKQQEQAQRTQVALQSIEQASNLVTASALIWSQMGFPWALPAIGVMWGSFAAAKIKAMQATKNVTYGEGGYELLQGGSHQSGNDIDLGTRNDGTKRRAEGGEYFAIINKRSSRRFRKEIPEVINALNDGTFADKYAGAYPTGELMNINAAPDLRKLEADVQAIKEQGDTSTYIDGNGNVVVKYKNLKRSFVK